MPKVYFTFVFPIILFAAEQSLLKLKDGFKNFHANKLFIDNASVIGRFFPIKNIINEGMTSFMLFKCCAALINIKGSASR